MVTEAPTCPEVGFRFVILGVRTTVKVAGLLATPETVAITGPVVAVAGTGTTILVAVQVVGDADVPLKVMELVP